jgi:hypothetical protein
MLRVHLHVLCAHKVDLRKTDFLHGMCKNNEKKVTKISLFATIFIFIAQPTKIICFSWNYVWAQMWKYIHAYTFSKLFWHFELFSG